MIQSSFNQGRCATGGGRGEWFLTCTDVNPRYQETLISAILENRNFLRKLVKMSSKKPEMEEASQNKEGPQGADFKYQTVTISMENETNQHTDNRQGKRSHSRSATPSPMDTSPYTSPQVKRPNLKEQQQVNVVRVFKAPPTPPPGSDTSVNTTGVYVDTNAVKTLQTIQGEANAAINELKDLLVEAKKLYPVAAEIKKQIKEDIQPAIQDLQKRTNKLLCVLPRLRK